MAWTNMSNKSNGNVVDSADWNMLLANFSWLGGTDGNTKTGNYTIGGTVTCVDVLLSSTGGTLYSAANGGLTLVTQAANAPITIHGNGTGGVNLNTDQGGTVTLGRSGSTTLVNSNAIGFFGAAAANRQGISGSKAGNAALASVIAALVNLGLATDSTT